MVKVKKIITGGLEFAHDSAKQLSKAISPGEMLKQALGQRQKSEFSEYLKKVGPDLTPSELEKKKKEFSSEEEKKLAEARQVIKAAIPDHMKLPKKPAAPRPYEATIQAEEKKKAQQVEAMKKTPKPVITPAGKPQPGGLGLLFGKKRVKGFEGLQKDTKVG